MTPYHFIRFQFLDLGIKFGINISIIPCKIDGIKFINPASRHGTLFTLFEFFIFPALLLDPAQHFVVVVVVVVQIEIPVRAMVFFQNAIVVIPFFFPYGREQIKEIDIIEESNPRARHGRNNPRFPG